jgi:DNA-binding CsgD family transcriptional regulator
MALVPPDPPSEVRTWAAATHARMSYAIGQLAEGDAAAEEALAAADALGLDSAWSDTAVSQVRSRQNTDPVVVERRLEEALRRARRSGDVDVEMRVLYNRATIAFEAGRISECLDWTRTATTRARDLGMEWAFYPAELRHLQVTALYMLGEWDASLAEADLLARVPEMAAHVRAAGLLVLVGRGDAAAGERLAWARGLIPRLNAHVLLSMVTAAAEVDLAAWAGDPDTAVDAAATASRRLQEVWDDDHLAVLRLVATALGALGDAAAAARIVGDTAGADRRRAQGEPLVELARSAMAVFAKTVGEMGVEGKAWAARVEAEAARLRGEPAVEPWRVALEAFGFGHVYEEARSRWRLAEALLAADDRSGAAEQARAAHEVAVRLGAVPLRTAAETLIRRGRLDVQVPGGRRPAGVDAVFTPRETEVLALMAQGRTNRQIGAELYISEKTASVHVSNILAKLAASSRTEAVAVAAQRGLLPTG